MAFVIGKCMRKSNFFSSECLRLNGSQPQFIWNVCGKLVVGNLIFF